MRQQIDKGIVTAILQTKPTFIYTICDLNEVDVVSKT